MDYTEEYFKKCDKATMKELYFNQHDEDRNIPAIDKYREDCQYGADLLVYQIYCYDSRTKYLCKAFEWGKEEEESFGYKPCNFDLEAMLNK